MSERVDDMLSVLRIVKTLLRCSIASSVLTTEDISIADDEDLNKEVNRLINIAVNDIASKSIDARKGTKGITPSTVLSNICRNMGFKNKDELVSATVDFFCCTDISKIAHTSIAEHIRWHCTDKDNFCNILKDLEAIYSA